MLVSKIISSRDLHDTSGPRAAVIKLMGVYDQMDDSRKNAFVVQISPVKCRLQ